MADENQLKDAKITVRIDVKGAIADVDQAERTGGGRGASRPGQRPPSPGRTDADRDREQEERDRKARPRRARGGGASISAAAARRAPKLVAGAVKTIASAAALSFLADSVPAMIDARLESLDQDQVIARRVLESMESVIGVPFGKIGDGIRAIEAALPVIAAFSGTAIDLSRTNQILELGLDASQIAEIAKRQASIASIETSFRTARRKIGREALGEAAVSGFDQIKAALREKILEAFGANASTNQ